LKQTLIIFCILFFSFTSFSQESINESSNFSEQEIEENDEYKNRLSIGWAYYGRGNGVSAIYDREFFGFISQGIGVEEYFTEDEVETSFFLVTEIPIQKLFKITSGFEIYPGVEYGSFGGEFEAHPFLGFSYPIGKSSGIYTEIGSRGVFGLYLKF
tara:strand:- start:363 stop:830 length:468 start_codon:yes stop_codon:yes gene_type:complete